MQHPKKVPTLYCGCCTVCCYWKAPLHTVVYSTTRVSGLVVVMPQCKAMEILGSCRVNEHYSSVTKVLLIPRDPGVVREISHSTLINNMPLINKLIASYFIAAITFYLLYQNLKQQHNRVSS